MYILYNFDTKLWDDVNRKNMMFSIDNALIAAKIKELQGFSRTKYTWPLSFSLETNTVKNILLLHGVELNNKHHS
jgi:hypothetical protein